jgi:phospholipid/cholesterol/gamma-HCH transport system substrate-binding protein
MTQREISRALAIGALVLAIAVVAIVLLQGAGSSYTVQARFADAGQLVKGDLVEVGGRPVGKVTAIRLSDNGMADVELHVDDDVAPLHEGTIASIRTVGLAAITNRFVSLDPGPPNAPVIHSGAILPPTQTRGIVDLDQLLDTVDPSTRSHLRTIVRQAASAFANPAGQQTNAALRFLNPALGQTAALGGELVLDQRALERLVTASATATHALASRTDDLGASIDSTAAALRQVASRRAALSDTLARAPAVLRQGRLTLAHLDRALPAIDPLLRGLGPSVPPLAKLLREVIPVAANAKPAIAQIHALLPEAVTVLRKIPALDKAATPALASTTSALKGVLPIVAGLRAYGPDVTGGFFNGFGGASGAAYDANGHYLRISFEGAPSSFPGLLSPVPGASFPTGGYRTGLVARCPGGAEEPAPDGSNPWIPDASLCDPKDDHTG